MDQPQAEPPKTSNYRVSREGGLEELVKELSVGGKFIVTAPARISLVDDQLVVDVSVNVGTDPHPGLYFALSFDVPVTVPKISYRELLRKEVEDAGGDLAQLGIETITEEKAKEVLDGLTVA